MSDVVSQARTRTEPVMTLQIPTHRGCAAAGRRVLLLILVMLLLTACGRGSVSTPTGTSGASETARVQVVTLEPMEFEVRRYWSGQLQPLRSRVLNAPRNGEVDFLAVREGDRVNRGELLVGIASAEIEARRPVLENRQARLAEQLQRWERMVEREAAGQADVTEALIRMLEVSEALAELEATLETLSVRAPVSGWVNATFVERGSKVAEGQSLMALDDDDALGVRLVVPARDTAFLAATEHLHFESDADESLVLDRIVYGDSDRRGFAVVDLYLAGAADNRRMHVDVVYERREEALVVPWTAVARTGGATWVARVSSDDPARIERREVSLGRAHEAGVEVVDGLSAGDRVVRYEPRAHPEGAQVVASEVRGR